MRPIEKPADVTIVVGDPNFRGNPPKLSYDMFVKHLLDSDQRFSRIAAGLRAAVRIEEGLKDERVHLVEESDWELLSKAAEEPTSGYPLVVQTGERGEIIARHAAGRACLPFIDAIANAKPKAAA